MKFATSDHVYRGATCEEMRAAVLKTWECLDEDERWCWHCKAIQPEPESSEHKPDCIVRRLEGK